MSSLSSISEVRAAAHGLRCWTEIRLAALRRNVHHLRKHCGGANAMAVVKANAYGHGVREVAQALAADVHMFGVANVTESLAVRDALRELSLPPSPQPKIFVLSAVLPEERAILVREGFLAGVSSVAEAEAYSAHGPVSLHLAVDTGMGRMGVWKDDALATLRAIRALPNVTLSGICTHLPVADEDADFTREELARFHALIAAAKAEGIPVGLIHSENSAGAIAFPDDADGMIRLGLALYGVSPIPGFPLEPALTWKTRVILVRDVGPGRGISYGRTYITDRPRRIATLAVGYADGYPRQISNRGGYVLIAGHRCPLLGRVTMDQIMVDVTDAPGVAVGDEAILLGASGAESLGAETLAQWAGTIAWDIFTGLGHRVIRLAFDESPPFQTAKPR